MNNLYLFTEYFPYGDQSEHAFLQNEIIYLQKQFDKVVVIPMLIFDKKIEYPNLVVKKGLAEELLKASKIKLVFKALKDKYFYQEIFAKGLLFFTVKKIKRLIHFTARAQIANTWIKSEIIYSNNELDKNLFYTFWINEITFALSCDLGKTVISRAHGHDIYEDYKGYGYLPCYKITLKNLKKLYLVSQPAIDYLEKKYPDFRLKFFKYYLGVKNAEKLTMYSEDDTVRVVSCSYLIDRKRVDLLILGLKKYCEIYNKKLNWVHFGGGEAYDKLVRLAELIPKEFFSYKILGNVTNKLIINYYKNNPVDLFILTSELEGGVPVVLQEAQAHGIPIIGTNVGGIPEIVNEKVGVLLCKDPSPEEIGDAIYHITSDEVRFLKMRAASVENWTEKFNQAINYKNFTDEILLLLKNN